MEKKRRKEIEKEALELARRGGEKEQRAAWREVESDQDEEEDEKRERRSTKERREKDKDGEKRRGSSERDSSRQRHLRSSHHGSHSRSKSPSKVQQFIDLATSSKSRLSCLSAYMDIHAIIMCIFLQGESPPQAKRHRAEPEEDEEDRQVALVGYTSK